MKLQLQIMEKRFGAESPQLVLPLNRLALLYEKQGRKEEARPLLERIAKIKARSQNAKEKN